MAKRQTYADNALNRKLGRVGKPYGWTPPPPTSAPNPSPLFTPEPVPVDPEPANPPTKKSKSSKGGSKGSSTDMPFGGTFVTRDKPFSAEDTGLGEMGQKGTDRKRTSNKSKWMKHAGKLKGLALWTLIPMLLADMLQHGKGYGAAGRVDALKKMEGKIQKRNIMTTPNRLAAMKDSSDLMGTLGAMQKALNAPEKRKYSEAFGRSPRVFGKDRI